MAQPTTDAVNHWVTKGFVALCGLVSTLLLLFFGWIGTNVSLISNATVELQSEFNSTSRSVQAMASEMSGLKTALDSLRIQSAGWATKDMVTATKDDLRADLSKVKEHVTSLEIRMTKLEAGYR